ncbi:MAG TPA: hypothetical protein VKV40_11810 [Ktedonobacteraceae bacterium]|nr:hypothetical protein [Ktedonobacteraceae bacterium]
MPTETLPERRAGGWSIYPDPRIDLGLGSDDELLLLENKTHVAWMVYHNFHRLGIIDPGEVLVFHLVKHGSLSARPVAEGDAVEYLVLSLNFYVNYVHIYRRQMGEKVEIYDMRVV